MIRRLVCIVSAVAVAGLVCGCEKPPVSTNPDAPLKTNEGMDSKGKKGKVAEVSIEDPTAHKK
jgi:ABC-type uncharacterized transport system auxiliary subunit